MSGDVSAPRSANLRSGPLDFVFGGGVLDRFGSPTIWIVSILLFAARVWLARPFFRAGWARIQNWESQPTLFEYVHPVPFLPPAIAVYATTAGETLLSVALVLGLFGRFAALGLAIMAATILFIVGQTPEGIDSGIANMAEQVPWIIVGLALFVIGAGRLSLDDAIRGALARS